MTADAKAGAALQSVHDGCIGFVKAAAKELAAKGITVNMVQVNPELLDSRPPPGTRRALRHTLDYFLTDKCAYVSGQTLNLSSRHLLDMPIESNGDDLTQHWQEAEQRVRSLPLLCLFVLLSYVTSTPILPKCYFHDSLLLLLLLLLSLVSLLLFPQLIHLFLLLFFLLLLAGGGGNRRWPRQSVIP